MTFHFGQLIAHLCKTRNARAGSIVGSGTVSNKDWARGYSCIAEKRAIETIEGGAPKTPFMRFGDTIRIEMKDAAGRRSSARSTRRWRADEPRRRWRDGSRSASREGLPMSDDLPRTLKFATIWLRARCNRLRRLPVAPARGAEGDLHDLRRRRRDPPQRRRPLSLAGNAERRERRLPRRHRRDRRRDPGRARRSRCACAGEATVRSSTAGGWVTGRVVRADLAL